MTIFISLVAILQSFSVAFGVGSSTLAVVNFFVAIADGKIDETERKMMGVVYITLRIAMVSILVTTLVLLGLQLSSAGMSSLNMFDIALLFSLAVLFANAVLMTLRIMPSTFGPALQAGSWYTLGVLMALRLQDITDFTFPQFFLAYFIWMVVAIALVNGILSIIKRRNASPADH